MSFRERLANVALLWGIPSLFLELMFLPYETWLATLQVIVPGTFIGVVAFAGLEHWLFVAIRKHREM